MNSELDKSRLIKIDNPDKFMRFVLRCFKRDRGRIEQFKHKRLALKYKPFNKEFYYLVDIYVIWGFLEKEETVLPQTEKGTYLISVNYAITQKGFNALKWRVISPFYPGWLSENRKWSITTAIAIVAILISIIAFIRTF